MRFLQNLVCGSVIGVAEIIPGVSGGTLAVLLNIYDRLIHAISHLKEDWKKNLWFLFQVGAGMGLSILGLSHVIKYLLANYPMAVNFFFLGLILGIIPLIAKKAAQGAFKKIYCVPFFVTFLIMIALAIVPMLLGQEASTAVLTTMNVPTFFRFMIVGALAALCFILPGISGSMIMVIFGIYDSVINAISDLNIVMLIPVAIGALGGLLCGARLVDYCLKKAPQATYFAILGLVIGSILSVYNKSGFVLMNENGLVISGVVAIGTAMLGVLVSLVLASEKVQKLTEKNTAME